MNETLDPSGAELATQSPDPGQSSPEDEWLPVDFDPPPFRGAAETFGRAVEVWLRELKVIGPVVVGLWLPVELAKWWFFYATGHHDELRLNLRIEAIAGGILTSITTPAAIYAVVTRFRLGRSARFAETLRWGWGHGAQTFRSRLLASVATLLGLLLLVAPGVLAALWFALLGPVIAIEGLGQRKVLTRSRELARGREWKILRLSLLVILAYMIFSLTLGIVVSFYERWWTSALQGLAEDVALAVFDVALALAYLGIVGRQEPVAAPVPAPPSTPHPAGSPID